MQHNYTYAAFGELVNESGSTENNYQFAGEQFDKNLGNYYLRQRFYDSNTGKFNRRDSYEGRFDEPLTLHKYLYTDGNPVNGIDPSGLSTLTLTEANATFLVLGTLAHSFNIMTRAYNPEPLGGFNDDRHLSIPTHTGSAISNILNLHRFGGFGEGPQPQQARSTNGFPVRTADDLIAYIFTANTDKLRASMEDGGYSFSAGEHAHHIVPVNLAAGVYARAVLNSYGIDLDSAINGVGLSERAHLGRGYHTADAIDEVTHRIIDLDSRAEVEAELRKIASEMQAGTFRF